MLPPRMHSEKRERDFCSGMVGIAVLAADSLNTSRLWCSSLGENACADRDQIEDTRRSRLNTLSICITGEYDPRRCGIRRRATNGRNRGPRHESSDDRRAFFGGCRNGRAEADLENRHPVFCSQRRFANQRRNAPDDQPHGEHGLEEEHRKPDQHAENAPRVDRELNR